MKRRIALFLLAAAISVAFAGCSNEADKAGTSEAVQGAEEESTTETEAAVEEWVKEDFYIYDLNGELKDFPLNNQLDFYYDDPDALTIQTYRGVKINESAKVALAKYDFTNCIVVGSCWPLIGSKNDKEKAIIKKFQEKYPDKNDRVLHNEELAAKKLSLFITGEFYEKDGKFIPKTLDATEENFEKCSIYPQYTIGFRAVNGKVAEIWVSNREEPYQDPK